MVRRETGRRARASLPPGGRVCGWEKARPDLVWVDAQEGRDGQIGARMALAERPMHALWRKTGLSTQCRERRAAFTDCGDDVGPVPTFFRAQIPPLFQPVFKNEHHKSPFPDL